MGRWQLQRSVIRILSCLLCDCRSGISETLELWYDGTEIVLSPHTWDARTRTLRFAHLQYSSEAQREADCADEGKELGFLNTTIRFVWRGTTQNGSETVLWNLVCSTEKNEQFEVWQSDIFRKCGHHPPPPSVKVMQSVHHSSSGRLCSMFCILCCAQWEESRSVWNVEETRRCAGQLLWIRWWVQTWFRIPQKTKTDTICTTHRCALTNNAVPESLCRQQNHSQISAVLSTSFFRAMRCAAKRSCSWHIFWPKADILCVSQMSTRWPRAMWICCWTRSGTRDTEAGPPTGCGAPFTTRTAFSECDTTCWDAQQMTGFVSMLIATAKKNKPYEASS